MIYFKKIWINNYKKIFIILKIKNQYANNKGKNNSEYNLISHLKSLDKVYFTNNICESIHSKISNICLKVQFQKNAFMILLILY